mgnify:CR=1 FL=1
MYDFLRLGAALRDNGFHLLKRIHNTALLLLFFRLLPQRGEKAGTVSGVADRTLGRADIDERVIVAVGQNPADKDKIARVSPCSTSFWREREKNHAVPGVQSSAAGPPRSRSRASDFAVSLILADNRHQRSLFEKFR